MAIWGKLKDELDRAGKAAQKAVDEGKVRLDLMRARQRADRAAQALGYAVYDARKVGADITAEHYHRLAGELTAAQSEVETLERQLTTKEPPADVGANI
jgi:hypothetical protein